jgi:hypothetical protein
MKSPKSVQALTELGRVRLSKSFFMRDMLYSEIAAVHGLLNVPDDPELAIKAGTRLCEDIFDLMIAGGLSPTIGKSDVE